MQNNDQVVKIIAQCVATFFSAIKDTLAYDKTFRCKIKSITGTKYTVVRAGQEYTCSALNSSTYVINDKVWVIAPCNDWSELLILGKVGE